jgi:3-hydroxyisobutyrate dehydrogenase-like beta-hydroxyacid dehydrogenase
MRIGFLGLGHMGQAMARNLLRAGHSVAVWDRTPSKAEQLASGDGARVATSPADAGRDAQAVLSMLADDLAVLAVVLGEGRGAQSEPLIRGLAAGAIHVSMSTIGPATSKTLAEAHGAKQQRYVAAPVLGRPESAERRELVILAAGAEDATDACAPLFDALGRATHRLGVQPERANVAKLAANLVLASAIEVLGEVYALAESYGVGAPVLLGVLKDTVLRSETLAGYGKRIADAQFEPAGFRLKLGLKDVDLVLAAAEAVALAMPTASVLRDRFIEAIARGLEDKDWSAVARTLPHK